MRWLAASFILLLAPLAHAGDPKPRRSAKLQNLQQDIASPDKFDRYVEGSPELKAGVAVPAAVATQKNFQAKPLAELQKPRPALRPEAGVMPPMPVLKPLQARSEPKKPLPLPGGLETGLALTGAVLILVGLRSWAPVPESTHAPALPQTKLPTPELEAPRIAEAPAPQSPVDVEPLPSLPKGTPEMSPYAISWQEQRLIEEWDRSAEKAAGRMDLETWIQLRGPAAGIDPSELRSKISRDA